MVDISIQGIEQYVRSSVRISVGPMPLIQIQEQCILGLVTAEH